MADSKQNVGEPDRSRVSGSEDYEVQYFAEQNGITPEQVRQLIAQHGNDRETLERAAAGLKKA
jgi:hypothetical protein